MSDTDLWNETIPDPRRTPRPKGHAGPVGSGPKGETCGSCRHYTRLRYSKTYLKCGLMKKQWTSGPGTDIRAKDSACWKWEASEPEPTPNS